MGYGEWGWGMGLELARLDGFARLTSSALSSTGSCL